MKTIFVTVHCAVEIPDLAAMDSLFISLTEGAVTTHYEDETGRKRSISSSSFTHELTDELYTVHNQNPEFTYGMWRESVRQRMTDMGYNEWVWYMIDHPEEDEDEDTDE